MCIRVDKDKRYGYRVESMASVRTFLIFDALTYSTVIDSLSLSLSLSLRSDIKVGISFGIGLVWFGYAVLVALEV
ncbi:hypothetical protein VNO80_29282 [Phaseolus coccineus]|uniref:Transmembrane protein n=1 Tax=Phaseolus coccineus TaxID=3886 RepID=A0AAN9LE23_PHACN